MKMRSEESNDSLIKAKPLAADFVLPVFEEPTQEHWPLAMSWSDAIRHFAAARDQYMRHFDSPERRLGAKNPKRFRL